MRHLHLPTTLLAALAALPCSRLAALEPVAPLAPKTYMPPVQPIKVDPASIRTQLYVSAAGDDAADGLAASASGKSGPFRTIERGRDEVRKLHAAGRAGAIAVNIEGGAYCLDHTITFRREDSGSADAPVVYRAADATPARLMGAIKVPATDFKPVTDPATAARIDPAARGHVLELDLQKLGVTHAGPFPLAFNDGGPLFELFFGSKRMPMSRWPVEGYTTMARVLANGDAHTPGAFVYREERPARWNADHGIWLRGKWRVGWEDWAIKVAGIDAAKKTISFAAGIPSGIGSKYKRPQGSGQEPWCAINLLEEITQPGQWCIDFTTHTLYFWPPGSLADTDALITQVDTPVIAVEGASHLVFAGLTIEKSLGDGIAINGDWNLVAGCTIRDLAGHGAMISGSHDGVQSCDMYGLGQGCVVISGGDRQTLAPSGNYVVNNHLHHYGVLKTQYSAGVDLYHDSNGAPAVGIYVAHNLIHHSPRDGVLFAGEDNVFEYNDISRCAYDSNDVGAFYSWRDWTIRNAIIRFNFIHDTVGGVNPDDGASGIFVYANVIAGESSGVWIASGPDNVVLDNIFVKSKGPVYGLDDRGVSRGYATNKALIGGIQAIHPGQAPWSQRYPEMPAFLSTHPELPVRNQFSNNVIYIKEGEPAVSKINKKNEAGGAAVSMTNNFVTSTDPGFAGPGNYTLKPDSDVFKHIPDFPHVSYDKAGLYIDEYRTRLPTAEEAGRLPSQDPYKIKDPSHKFST